MAVEAAVEDLVQVTWALEVHRLVSQGGVHFHQEAQRGRPQWRCLLQDKDSKTKTPWEVE